MLEVPSPPAADPRASPALHRASWAPQSWVERVVLGSRLFLSQLSCPEGQRTPSQTVSKAQPGVGMGVVGVALTGLGKQQERESSGQPGILLKPSQVSLRTAAAFPLPQPSPTSRQVLPTFPSGLLGWTFATVSNTRSRAGRDVTSNFPWDGQTPSHVFSFSPGPQEISGLGFAICIMGVVVDARHRPGLLLMFSLSSLDSLS